MKREKKSKAAVNYGEGDSRHHCGNCVHFEVEAPHHCELVKGIIKPDMWCKLYKRRGK